MRYAAPASPLDAPIRTVREEVRDGVRDGARDAAVSFEQCGRMLSLVHDVDQRGARGAAFYPRLDDNAAALHRALEALERQVTQGAAASSAVQWLLDNAALLQEQMVSLRRMLPRDFYKRLPVLRVEAWAGLPRIYGVAWAWVAHADSAFDAEQLRAFLAAYQARWPLTLAELGALQPTLRVVLFENLRRLAERVATHASNDDSESAADVRSIRNVVTTLRQLERIDWSKFIARCSAVQTTLRQIPTFDAEHAATQSATLHAIERLARTSRRSEAAVAEQIVALTAQAEASDDVRAAPGYWCRGDGENALRLRLGLPARRWPRLATPRFRRWATGPYLAVLLLLTGAATWAMLHLVPEGTAAWLVALTAVLAIGPLSEAVVAMLNRLIIESVPPAQLPRMAFDDGVPPAHRPLVVMPVMLGAIDAMGEMAAQLEQHALANPQPHAQFALLSDHADADRQSLPGDGDTLQAARQAIEALNERHGASADAPRFLLLHRERTWSESEQAWIGWERKRGKLEQLVRALVEPGYRPFVDLGPLSTPAAGTRYIVTLDADTDLPPGRLQALVGIAAHPLNQPRWDAAVGRIVDGYGILQPRVETALPAPDQVTGYHRLFSGQCGLDPYSAATSEVYQDVFGEGTFTGKGLLHVAALHAALTQRLPDAQVLSHDLLEGSLARCANVTDVTVIEEAPVHADVAASRLHRWTRGDWQLLPFLAGPRRLPLAAIHRWKMVDNLRRSLVAPSALAFVLVVLCTGSLPLAWALAIVAAAFSAGPILGALAGLAPSRDDIALARFYRFAVAALGRSLLVGLWHIVQLLQLAMLYLDAAGRALWRQVVSRRLLLQWTTAAAAQAAASTRLAPLVRRHWAVPLAALLIGAGLAAAASAGWALPVDAVATMLVIWALSPLWTWLASKPKAPAREARLDAAATSYVADLARDTWRYYELHVTARHLHLPPDNVQLMPQPAVAPRTSPTNIGLYLLAATCARELGFIGMADLAERLDRTLTTVERLPKHDGHLFNWYDTRDGSVLRPAYVSTVDSGNLAAHLLVVAQACEELARSASPMIAPAAALSRCAARPHGLRDTLRGIQSLSAVTDLIARGARWPQSAAELAALQSLVQAAQGQIDALALSRNGDLLPGPMWLLHDLVALWSSHLADAMADMPAVQARLLHIAGRARRLALAMDFKPLYDRTSRLLHIGMHAATRELDNNHYDLLASEARLASLVAIAKGDVPAEHWSALGRPFYADGLRAGLRSWSGSMFEYLMPSLVLDEPIGSALHEATCAAVAEQRREGRTHGTPWGISESAIADQDDAAAYQYGPQGAPRLALRRALADERVLAPYASGLALLVAPKAAVSNLRALEALGARRTMGFVDALDFTPQRQTSGGAYTVVETHMAHHQAMILVACCSLLCDDAPRGWGARAPHLRAISGLLQERVPSEMPPLTEAPTALPRTRQPSAAAARVHEAPPLIAVPMAESGRPLPVPAAKQALARQPS
jgi:cyclic beta-1,2-glucan synthetase